MKREHDFSRGEREKFYHKGAELRVPIYLDAKLQGQLERIAENQGKELSDLVDQLVRKQVELLQELL
jgi:cytidylate kinase